VFRNLLHHHTHVSNPGKAGTFWSGCGAIRTAAVLDVGGFDEKYAFPSVEDIELGMRITANGGRIVLVPELLCKHLKRWTVASMVITDIVHRARPWTHLIMNSRELPATLNMDWRGRLSGICSILLAGCLVAATFTSIALWVALPCGLALIALNNGFYRLCLKKRGVGFAFSAAILHWLYFVYSSMTFIIVAAETLAFERCTSIMGRLQPSVANRATRHASGLSPVRS
jgi:cellulose synthase/poly-beta-1,6-N-acetylglucosamine synthase-like glycosyltransferase